VGTLFNDIVNTVARLDCRAAVVVYENQDQISPLFFFSVGSAMRAVDTHTDNCYTLYTQMHTQCAFEVSIHSETEVSVSVETSSLKFHCELR
jgi:hypothetical protein